MSSFEVVIVGGGRPASSSASHRGIAAPGRSTIESQDTGRSTEISLGGRHPVLSVLGRATDSRLLLFGQSTCQIVSNRRCMGRFSNTNGEDSE